jgi:hypothetical protein
VSSRRRHLLAALAFVTLALPARGDGPVLHEYFEPNPSEDLALAATTPSGDMPAAIETPSGLVSAPDATRAPAPTEVAYGGTSTPESLDATYQIDRDTTRPEVVDYDDPFIPAVTPFKRLFAYDRVDASLELVVADKELSKLEVGGSVRAGDDSFYGDMVVDLAAETPVRIPSVGPGARVLAAHTYPPTEFALFRDGADNWFVKAPARKRVRLVVQLAIARSAFGSEFPDVPWSSLEREVRELPEGAKTAALEVANEIGISRAMSPRAALAQLVAHFRAFAPSGDRPKSSGIALYKELALSQKGVCRHRAYAFVITAHALGLPSRMVRNEAHAWVEVFDGSIWHRIDLGGAAGELETQQDPSLPQHQPPADPYTWPAGSESGRELASRSLSGDPSAPENAPDAPAAGSAQQPAPIGPAAVDAGAGRQDDSRPESLLSLKVDASDVRRGEPLVVSGRVSADGEGCPRVRVDFALKSGAGTVMPIQSLSADGEGRYSGAIVVPLGVDVGDYEVLVSTPGGERCGPGSPR